MTHIATSQEIDQLVGRGKAGYIAEARAYLQLVLATSGSNAPSLGVAPGMSIRGAFAGGAG